MNSPRCSAAQNGCTTSGTWPVTNRAIHPSSQEAEEDSARARRGPGDPARADRRYGSPSGLASATTDAHPLKRPGRLPQPGPDDPVLRSPREPKVPLRGSQCGAGNGRTIAGTAHDEECCFAIGHRLVANHTAKEGEPDVKLDGERHHDHHPSRRCDELEAM